MKQPIKSHQLVCKPSESNASRELPLTMLVAQMIDLATDHANDLDIGYHKLSPRGVGWVLSRLSVEMRRWPSTGEQYFLSTWVENWNAHFSERCFSVKTLEGEVLGYGRTVWVIIDLDSHRSVGTAGLILPEALIYGDGCPVPRMARHRPFETDCESEYTFKYTDLDFYRHVNTVKYISLLLNQYTLSEFDSNLLSRFDIAFAHEARYGETALIRSIEEEVKAPDLLPDASISKKRTFELTVSGTPILTASIVMTPKPLEL